MKKKKILHTINKHRRIILLNLRLGFLPLLCIVAIAAGVVSCARMGQPDGGWYDETPPQVVSASPKDGSTGVKTRKVSILFSEYVKIDNATEKVVVSPPQIEMPEIKTAGKRVEVELKDTLKPDITYTVDFSDAISDNNEGNPLGNYTYSFSTGSVIDTLQVAGYVLESENLEPVKGILVGLYSEMDDSAFVKRPMLRVARTDSQGKFIIKGVAPGKYRIYALQDADGNYCFNQKSEKIAFSRDTIIPSFKPDIRQDTTWLDSLRIKSIAQVGYTHFLPDDIVLRAFTETQTDRHLLKSDRSEPDHFSIFFSYGSDTLPTLRGLNFNADKAFLIEQSMRRDTITYWLRDTALVNQDTLDIELRYMASDTLGVLRPQTDTLQILSKQPYERRIKQKQKDFEEWEKKQKRNKKRGEAYDSIMPTESLKCNMNAPSSLDPDKNIGFEFATPIASLDTAKIHLYSRHDTLWYKAPFEIDEITDTTSVKTEFPCRRRYILRGEWRPDIEYSLEIDSAAFTDIYGKVSEKIKQGFKVRSMDDYSSLMLNIEGISGVPMIVQLLDGQDKTVKQVRTNGPTAQFFYVNPGKYYVRLIVDSNGNGQWDTGNYATGLQPESVYYYPEEIECRAKWDVTQNWNPTSIPLQSQKPSAITKQKGEQKKKIRMRNIERARQLGIVYPGDESLSDKAVKKNGETGKKGK